MKEQAKKSYWLAVALTFFLGGIGVHKFYLGKTGMGVLYLLFFWTYVPVVASLIELVVMLIAGEKQFNKKYNA